VSRPIGQLGGRANAIPRVECLAPFQKTRTRLSLRCFESGNTGVSLEVKEINMEEDSPIIIIAIIAAIVGAVAAVIVVLGMLGLL
jgi:hypothetical protein